MIQLLVLGSGTSVPTPRHGPPAYWVVVDGRPILLDPGPGALVRLVASPHAPDSVDGIDTVLFTHLHIDHCCDLPALLFALHNPVPRSTRPLQLIGPRGLQDYLARLHDLYGSWLEPKKRELMIQEIRPAEVLVAGQSAEELWRIGAAETTPHVAAFAAHHPQNRLSEDSLGFRIHDAEGNVLVFSGDSDLCPELVAASRDADLLLVECSTPDELATAGHLTPSQVGRLCQEAAPHQTVLTHLYPPVQSLDLPALIGEHWDGPVTVACDGDLFSVPPRDQIAEESP